MMKMNGLLAIAASLAMPAALAGCIGAPDDGVDCLSGRCDDVPDSEVPDSPCDGIITDHSGAGHKKVAGRNQDAFSKLVLQTGDSCKTTFQDMMAKLREVDKDGCAGERDGITTRFIGEVAQLTQTPGSYRTVTTRRCGSRGTEGIIFSQFARSTSTAAPANAEIISFDETSGVFNFYDTDGSSMNFFGSSKDLLLGPDGEDRRCAACHVNGGLVMKELDTPWANWEGHVSTPGTDQVAMAVTDFGTKTNGAEFEGVVKNANTKWNKVRIAHLKSVGAKAQDILRPLFCTQEINIDNGANFDSPIAGGTGGDQLSSIGADSLLDPTLKGFASISITFQDYDDLIRQNGQRVDGVAGAIDTIIDYQFVERSHIDNDYVQALKAAGIVDDDFIKDVLMVDFTRPIFSDDRCGLLTFAPDLSGDQLTAAAVRDGFISALESESPAAGSPGATLLASLKSTSDGAEHDAKVEAFLTACKGLGSRQFLANALAITSLNRNKARELPVIETPPMLPTDNQSVDPASRLDPTTCQLTTSFSP